MQALVALTRRLGLILLATAGASQARAQAPLPYDFNLAQYGNPRLDENGKGVGTGFTTHSDADFRAFARQFAAAMTSANLAPPRTLGHSGFALDAELSVVDFRGKSCGGGAQVCMPTSAAFQGPLLMPSVHFRKGLPWSLELGARAAWIEKSSMGVASLELKWALNEGFTYLPDIAVRANVSRLVNARDLDLTAGGIDLGIGKQFAIGGMVTLTPYVGWNLIFVGASSGSVDFNRSRTQAQADAGPFEDIFAFTSLNAVENTHNRFYGGLRFLAGVVVLGGEVSYSVFPGFKNAVTGANQDLSAVLAWNSTLGLEF
jgi:hypothetical protein